MSTRTPTPTYRPEIDGLRGRGSHRGDNVPCQNRLNGGYVGVDIFLLFLATYLPR
jgi:hypothetical protein